MIIEHAGKRPDIHPEAWVAPDATVCGDVTVAAGTRIMHGARLVAEGGSIAIGRNCIVMQNAVLRSASGFGCSLANNILIGPNAHVVGATIEDEVFVATGAALFHGCHIGKGSEVRINGTVHIKTRLEPGACVPIGWIACGNPAQLFSPERHEALWEVQGPLNFPLTVYSIDRSTPDLMKHITERLSARLGGHRGDKVIG
ncbi:MAG TPA: gamma carbonic anhydrase family protein [Hyphomicrobiaceae bacterium]|nr:gamma carbonic anhydrase family protein [Hyphomicrobiaceae bacterium]